jgi:ABC-2 type transport system permease protein
MLHSAQAAGRGTKPVRNLGDVAAPGESVVRESLKRILLIAKRDYLQAVLTKAYLFGLIFVPLLIGGGFLVTSLVNRSKSQDQRIAVIDHTGVSAGAVIQAAEEATGKATNATGGLQLAPRFVFETIEPEPDERAQLLALCDQIRRGELYLVLDIGSDAVRVPEQSKRDLVHYYTGSGVLNQLNLWLPAAVNTGLRRVRLEQMGVDPGRIPGILDDVEVVSMDLLTKDPVTGGMRQENKKNAAAGAIPFFLVILMLMVVVVGAAPHLGAIAEDKMQRVYEMLLSSVSPFELMMGKVVASLGASLTSSLFYITGGLLVLAGMALFGLAPLNLLPWFFAYLIAEVAMLSAFGAALGSACNTPQDAQQLVILLILPIMLPMFLLNPVMQQPNGAFATIISFIPPFTPVLMLLRQSLPGGIPWWQPWLGLAGVIACAIGVIWAAARIFRIGILAQGKVPRVAELAQWVLRG